MAPARTRKDSLRSLGMTSSASQNLQYALLSAPPADCQWPDWRTGVERNARAESGSGAPPASFAAFSSATRVVMRIAASCARESPAIPSFVLGWELAFVLGR